MTSAMSQSIPTNPSHKTWPAWAMFVVGLLVTVFASVQVKQRTEAAAVQQVGFAYDQATLRIQERLNTYAQILRGAAGLFAASVSVERQEWRDYVKTLRTEEVVPGVQGIGFAQVIPPGQLGAHIAQIRQEGFPDYIVRPPGERAMTTAIIYLEPFRDRNLRAFGFDMFSESVRRAAMEQARDSGTVALSGKVELVQETAKEVQAGTLIYLPVYRNGVAVESLEQKRAALVGWAYSPYRMNDLMNGILRQWENDAGQAIDLQIYDGPQATPAALLFDSKPANTPGAQSIFYQQRRVDFGGRQWLLVFDYSASAAVINYASAWFVLIAGLVVSGLLLGLMRSMINTRTNAERIADGLVATILEREAALQRQAEVLARSNAELSRLGEVMAHHFQEPARRLTSFAQRLQGKPALVADEDSRLAVEFIDQQARRLSELVRDAQHYLALEHAKVGAGGTADSGAVLRQTIVANTDAAQAEIVLGEFMPKVRLAENLLSELFAILLDNALRYSKSERPLRIKVGATVSGERAVFRFADNGSGIAPEYRLQVFDLFTRLVPNSVPGTGTGLALVRKIVQQTGGDVCVEDGLDGGTCIVFDLPLETRL
jgi:CHASE1-domain containing sensor protein/nitrogen-specific signal transduction histidine kinase